MKIPRFSSDQVLVVLVVAAVMTALALTRYFLP